MTRAELDAIRQRAENDPKLGETQTYDNGDTVTILRESDRRVLLAEVERLKAEVALSDMRLSAIDDAANRAGILSWEFDGDLRAQTLCNRLYGYVERKDGKLWKFFVAEYWAGGKLGRQTHEGFAATKAEAMRDVEKIIVENIAFKRGVAAMRQTAADLFEGTQDKAGLAKMPLWAKFIRDLPDPEDK